MKTLHSRLQSRISKRRNLIREVEEDVAILRFNRRHAKEDNPGPVGEEIFYMLSENLRDARRFVNELADDQRLDKKLKNLVVGYDGANRFYGFPELT